MKPTRMLAAASATIVGIALLMSQQQGHSGPKKDPSKAVAILIAEEGNVIYASPVVEGRPISPAVQKQLDRVSARQPDGTRRTPDRPDVPVGVLLVFDPPLPEGSVVEGPSGEYKIKGKPRKMDKWWKQDPGARPS